MNHSYRIRFESNNACSGQIPLNPLGMEFDSRYTPLQCGSKVCYEGTNPLLYEPMRGQKLLLDRPNLVSNVKVGDVSHDNIYTPLVKSYGGKYCNYEQIAGGQIQYWVPYCSNVFESPVFTTSAVVADEIYIDPMGVAKPQYSRYPTPNLNDTSVYDSRTLDTIKYRENLMASQLATMNQTEFKYLYLKK
jgi:hypothetical protein